MNKDKYAECFGRIAADQSNEISSYKLPGGTLDPANGEFIASRLEKTAKEIRELVSVYNLENKGK